VSALFIIGIYETLSSTFLISLRQKSKLLTQHIKIAKAPQSGIFDTPDKSGNYNRERIYVTPLGIPLRGRVNF
jgi:hypothetical protein